MIGEMTSVSAPSCLCDKASIGGGPFPWSIDEAPPILDDISGRFWCATGVNAYDIPDASEWQDKFRSALENCGSEDGGDCTTPTRRPRGDLFGSPPSTPPKHLASSSARPRRHLVESPTTPRQQLQVGSPMRRFAGHSQFAARAAHTRALLAMRRRAGISANVHGREIAFYRFGATLFAVEARCPHQGGDLCAGEVGDIEDSGGGCYRYVTCPVHKMQFDLSSGRVLRGDCPPLQTFAVRICEVDAERRIAAIEVGFEALTSDYFSYPDDV
mmetsp:Transcript_45988/g.127686  ORF Transcript_45988/g.127686 Transcript_45988/m.127686 type:complete len:271 (-) Transcript_45988:192-1004(-)